jgi:hypothetical protein
MPHRLVTAAYIAVIVVGAGVANNYASSARSSEKMRSSESSCNDIGNPGRALDRLDAVDGHELELREQFQPIVDCHRTYFDNRGVPVPLDFDQQRLYVEWIRRGIRPVIRADGSVAPQ